MKLTYRYRIKDKHHAEKSITAFKEFRDAANEWQLLTVKTAKVGDGAIKAGVVYSLNDDGELTEVAS